LFFKGISDKSKKNSSNASSEIMFDT